MHKFLKDLIECQINKIKIFKSKEEDAVYTFSIFEPEYKEWNEEVEKMYSSFEICFENACNFDGRIRIQKRYIDSNKRKIQVEVNKKSKVIDIVDFGDFSDYER